MKLFECKTWGVRETGKDETMDGEVDRELFSVYISAPGIGKAADAAQSHFDDEKIVMDSLEIRQVKEPFIEKPY